MPSKKARRQLTNFLSHHLSTFGDGFTGLVVCPTCMTQLHSEDDFEALSAGHIVPESAGGKDWTLLCKTCNSDFGKRQDKWFGEYLCILKNPEGTFLHSKSKSKYITVNGVKVSGKFGISETDGAVEVFLPINRNPPGKVDSVPRGDTLEVQFTPELVKHVNEVQVGYITTAYLMWFKEIGYNWVLQSSQALVRKQIIECNYMLDGAKVVELQGEQLHEPDIGVIIESGHVYPCCLIYDRVVIFPAPSGSKAPSPKKILFNTTYELHLLTLKIMNKPYSVSIDKIIAVLPDMLRKDPPIPENMFSICASSDEEAQWLELEN